MKNADPKQLILAQPGILAKSEIMVFCVIMDRSGSMKQHGDVPREAINKHLKTLKTHPNADSALGFVITFADTSRFDIEPMPLKDMPTLAPYNQDGNTLLYGTVLKALEQLLELKTALEDKGLKVHLDLTVYTDGQDNESQDKREPLVRAAGQALEAGAHLMLCAIGLDKDRMAQEMGFPPKDAVQIARSASAIGHSMIGVTQRTYRTMTFTGSSSPSTPVPPSSH